MYTTRVWSLLTLLIHAIKIYLFGYTLTLFILCVLTYLDCFSAMRQCENWTPETTVVGHFPSSHSTPCQCSCCQCLSQLQFALKCEWRKKGKLVLGCAEITSCDVLVHKVLIRYETVVWKWQLIDSWCISCWFTLLFQAIGDRTVTWPTSLTTKMS